VGFGVSAAYFIVDQTVGWDWLTENFGLSDANAKEMWNDVYSGKRPSKIIDR
jgi:hypothetical protein